MNETRMHFGSYGRSAARVKESTASRLAHVRWIGGGSGAGKSTVARRMAECHRLLQYSTDEAIAGHTQRSNPVDDPLLHQFLAMDMDERWVHRSPELMLDTFHGFTGESFHRIVDDLLDLPARLPVLAEGFRLLPSLVAPLLIERWQAVWLLPTPPFRRAAFETRGFTWEIPSRTSDPERALANLLRRDELFTARVTSEADELGLQAIAVDIGTTIDELTSQVEQALRLDPKVAGS